MTRASAPNKVRQHECCGIPFPDQANPESYGRHLVFDHVVAENDASPRERFEALAPSLRDRLAQRRLLTQEPHDKENPKRV